MPAFHLEHQTERETLAASVIKYVEAFSQLPDHTLLAHGMGDTGVPTTKPCSQSPIKLDAGFKSAVPYTNLDTNSRAYVYLSRNSRKNLALRQKRISCC